MLIERKKREHALLLYLLKSNKKKVAKLHVFRAQKTAMWPMLRCSHFVNISIQALQTSSNVNSRMLNELAKREQLFFLYSLKASNNKVGKLHVFECELVQPCAATSNCSSAMSFASPRLPLGMKAGPSRPKVSPRSNLFFSSF
jgi:hypothetical protein